MPIAKQVELTINKLYYYGIILEAIYTFTVQLSSHEGIYYNIYLWHLAYKWLCFDIVHCKKLVDLIYTKTFVVQTCLKGLLASKG